MADQVKYTQKLKGSKVLVIGGSSGTSLLYHIAATISQTDEIIGIGYSVAEALVENGSEVIVSSSNPSRVEKTVSTLKKAYPSASSKISGHACNLGEESTLEKNVVELFEKVGKLDHVIYTAGDALASMSIEDVDLEKIKKAGMVRFFGPLLVGKIAPKYLSKGPESSIIFTTGAVAERPIPNWTVINSYATGLQGMTRGLALDLKPIRQVICI